MKTQRKHGFTIVELVVVIAVIAILAAVLIPTFVSIIKKANDSAYVQERQNQRIDDIAQKLDNETWVSWEDMEVKIADAISNAHPSGSTLTAAEVNEAIKSALEEYAVAHQSDNTGLTEAQVQKIVSEATSGNVTLEQVQALIAKIPTGSSGVTTAQVQAIVNQALAGVSASGTGLNASQVNQLVTAALNTYANEHPGVTVSDINTAIAAALANFKTLSEEDVVAIVNNVTSTSASVITLTGTEAGNGYTVTSDNAGKTVYLMTNRSSTDTYTISGENVKKVVIDAPNMTDVVVACDAEEVVVIRTAMTSVHITGNVTTLEINSGHVEIESDAIVTTVTAAPSTNATVKVTVEGAVTTLNAEYQDHGTGTNDTIEIVNAGTIGTSNLTASEALEVSGETTTNVSLTNVGESTTPAPTASVAIPADTEVSVNTATTVDVTPESTTPITVNASTGEGTYASYVARIGSTGYETLQAAIDAAQSGETVVLLKDVTLTTPQSLNGNSVYAAVIEKSITLDGGNHTITAGTTRVLGIRGTSSDNFVDVVIKNVTLKASSASGAQCIYTQDYLNSLTLDNVIADNTSASSGYIQAITVSYANDTTSVRHLTIKDSKVLNAPNKYYTIILWIPVEMEITNSELAGWSPLYFKPGSGGSSVTVNGGKMISVGNAGKSNDFGLINFENGARNAGINVDIKNTDISVSTTASDSHQYLVSFSSWYGPNTENTVSITGGSLTFTGNNALFQKDSGIKNSLNVSSCNINVNGVSSSEYSYISAQPDNLVAYMYMNGTTRMCCGGFDVNELLANSGSWFCNGEWIEFYDDEVALTSNATISMRDPGMFGFYLGNSTLNAGEYTIEISNGVTVVSDKQLSGVFSAPEGFVVTESILDGDPTYNYSYTIVEAE